MAEHGAIVIQIGNHRTQVHFQNRFMHFQFQLFRYQIKVEYAGTFYQNDFRMKGFENARS